MDPDVLKALLGGVGSAVGTIIGAGIAFGGVWLTQRATETREERKSELEKEAALRKEALQFISDVVAAARAMSSLTYYAHARAKNDTRFDELDRRIQSYETEIALLLTKIQAGQLALLWMAPQLGAASLRCWEAVRDQADEIDVALDERGKARRDAIAGIVVDVPAILKPLRKDFSQLLRPAEQDKAFANAR